MTLDHYNITTTDFVISVEIAAKKSDNITFWGGYLAFSGLDEAVD